MAQSNTATKPSAAHLILRLGSGVFFLVALYWLRKNLDLQWLDQAGNYSWQFGLGFVVATILAIPATPLVLLAGAAFGPWKAGLVVGAGSYAGSTLTFLLGRYWLRPLANNLQRRWPVLKKYDSVFETQGAQIVFCLRLSPLLPYNVANYIFGATPVSFRNYCLGNLGMLPHILVLVFLGGAIQAGNVISIAWTVILTVATTWLAAGYARTALARHEIEQPTPPPA